MNKWPKTEFTERLGVALPLIQAPMAGFTTPEFVAAVSISGGVGSLGAALMQPDEIRTAIRKIRTLTRRPFNVNLFYYTPPHQVVHFENYLKKLKSYERLVGFSSSMEIDTPPSFDKQVEVLLEEQVPIFSFTFGIPPVHVIRDFHRKNTVVIGTATHVREGQALQDMGVDYIVCQGKEAGGHRGSFLGAINDGLIATCDLVKEMAESIKKPLIASGGIMDGKEIRAAFRAGAVAVQMGTAFLLCDECGSSPLFKKLLVEWQKRETVLTRSFTGRWARAVANRFTEEMSPLEPETPPYPIAQSLTKPLRKAAVATENGEFMPLWAGERFSKCQRMPVGELIARLTLEIEG